MDPKDELLLACLRRNARMTTVELAARLGLSRSSVQSRLLRLEREGVISGYTVVMGDTSRAQQLRSWLMLTLHRNISTPDVLEQLRAVPGVAAVYLLTGEVDALVEVVSKTTQAIDDARLRIVALEEVADVRTHVVLRAAYPFGNTRPTIADGVDEETPAAAD